MRRAYCSRISSAMLLSERRTSSANGACSRHDRQESAGMRLVSADQGWRSRVRRSIACIVRQAGQRTHRNQCRALSAHPIVGENSIGIRLACRSFHAAIRRSASSRICPSVARRAAASFSATAARFQERKLQKRRLDRRGNQRVTPPLTSQPGRPRARDSYRPASPRLVACDSAHIGKRVDEGMAADSSALIFAS
jgi:hypothetical protein